jgi:hypothetical protein
MWHRGRRRIGREQPGMVKAYESRSHGCASWTCLRKALVKPYCISRRALLFRPPILAGLCLPVAWTPPVNQQQAVPRVRQLRTRACARAPGRSWGEEGGDSGYAQSHPIEIGLQSVRNPFHAPFNQYTVRKQSSSNRGIGHLQGRPTVLSKRIEPFECLPEMAFMM